MKSKLKTWSKLKDNSCPNCGNALTKDMFTGKLLGCLCGFVVTQKTANLLIKRDHDEKE